MTKQEIQRMRELQRKGSLSRSEHRELDELEAKFDEELETDENEENEEKKENEENEEKKEEEETEEKKEEEETEEKKEEEETEEKKEEEEVEEKKEKKEKPKKKLIEPENDHFWFKKRFGGRI